MDYSPPSSTSSLLWEITLVLLKMPEALQRTNHSPDFIKLLKTFNPEAAVSFAKIITNRERGNIPKASIDSVVQVFLENGRI